MLATPSAMPASGFYIPPTLLSNVHPTSIVAQQEIFGPVLAAMTFRTPSEAVELANNTVYGLAACVWSESINVALQVAAQLKAGVVWVNSTNLFDAACGFGGYRESGYGREGGREGLLEYLQPAWFKACAEYYRNRKDLARRRIARGSIRGSADFRRSIEPSNCTSAASRPAPIPATAWKCEPPTDAAWARRRSAIAKISATRRSGTQSGKLGESHAHNRAQVLYYMAENLSQRRDEIAQRLAPVVGEKQAVAEVELSIERIFSYAAWADKFDGAVHNPPFRNVAIAMNEAIGTVGIICPTEAPLLGFLSLVMPALAARQHGGRRSLGNVSADHRRPLSALRHQRSARRRTQHRHRI